MSNVQDENAQIDLLFRPVNYVFLTYLSECKAWADNLRENDPVCQNIADERSETLLPRSSLQSLFCL